MYKKIGLIACISTNIFAAQTYKEIVFEGLTQISNEVALETIDLEHNSYTIDEINKILKHFINLIILQIFMLQMKIRY